MLCIVAVALVLTGCKKKVEFNGFTINQGSTLQMVQGESVRLSMTADAKECTPVYTFECADATVLSVDGETGEIYAVQLTETPVAVTVTGTAVIDNEKVIHTQVINITVVDFAKSLTFGGFTLMMTPDDEPWYESEYYVYMKRRNRADEIPDGSDALDHTKEIKGNPAKIDSVFPKYNEWVHLYDTTIQGEKLKIGLFLDSVSSYRAWIFSSDCFFDADGKFQCAASQGAVIETFFAFTHDRKYSFVLGDREFVDDITALDTIHPDSVENKPFPGYFQAGHFDAETYVQFWTDYYSTPEGEEGPSMSDYPFFDMYDSKILPVKVGVMEDGSSATYTLPLMGYPTKGKIVLDSPDDASNFWLYTFDYEFDATVYANPMVGYCLKLATYVDEETGEEYTSYASPLQMSEATNITYKNGSVSATAIKPSSRTPENDNVRPVLTSALKVQLNVANTLGAIFRMTLRR